MSMKSYLVLGALTALVGMGTVANADPSQCRAMGGACIALGPPSLCEGQGGTLISGLCKVPQPPGGRPIVGGQPNCCVPGQFSNDSESLAPGMPSQDEMQER